MVSGGDTRLCVTLGYQAPLPAACRGTKPQPSMCSHPQVYNEQIYDLLEPKGPLAIREDPEKGVVVHGLSFHQVGREMGTRSGHRPLCLHQF